FVCNAIERPGCAPESVFNDEQEETNEIPEPSPDPFPPPTRRRRRYGAPGGGRTPVPRGGPAPRADRQSPTPLGGEGRPRRRPWRVDRHDPRRLRPPPRPRLRRLPPQLRARDVPRG